MEAVFAQSYVPKALRPAYLKRCAVLAAVKSPGAAWVKCLIELLSLASDNPAEVNFDDVLQACEASADSLARGFKPGTVPRSDRHASVTIAAKICAWHYDRPDLVDWLDRQLKQHAMLPDSGRVHVEAARRICESAVVFQGFMRTAAESHKLGQVLIRLIGQGRNGKHTLRMIWRSRSDSGLDYALRHRAWTFLVGLAEAAAGTNSIAAAFDADVWLCAAVERPSPARTRLLELLLAHFRHLKTSSSKFKCTSLKCMANVAVSAAFAHTFAPQPSLCRAVKLFMDEQHLARGCPHSLWRDTGFSTDRSCMQPAWGGDGSSGLAMIARECRDLNNRRNSRTGLGSNPTNEVLNAIAPALQGTVQMNCSDVQKLSASLTEGRLKLHTQQAVAVLSAAPFLDLDDDGPPASAEPWRISLLKALRACTPDYWHQCTRQLPRTASRIVSNHHAWLGRKPIFQLLESAAAARGFQQSKVSQTLCTLPVEGEEIKLLESLSKVVQMLSSPRRSPGAWLAAELQKNRMDLLTLASLEHALNHPNLSSVLLKGRYDGVWGRKQQPVTAPYALLAQAEESGGKACAELLRRECGLTRLLPVDRSKGWWHLGRAFPRAAVGFMIAVVGKRTRQDIPRLPYELAIMILQHAAAQAAPIRLEV